MSETIDQLIFRLAQDQELFSSGEEATRQGVILPILDKLGWNIYNIREVVPEFQVENGRVDYCLKIGEKKAVFLEVKRITEDLERHEKQLLEYSFKYGVDISVLKNGLLWWLYLPLARGSWQQRKFFTIDIKQQEPEIAAGHFINFLNRDAIANGSALNNAKSVQASREKEMLINQTIPLAWERILTEPDELFIELFADKVESMCGYKPGGQTIIKFLGDKFPRKIQEPKTTLITIPISRISHERSDINQGNLTSATKRKGAIIKINNKVFEAQAVSDLYRQVLKFLYDGGFLDKIKSELPYKTSGKRYLIALKPNHPHGNKFIVPVAYRGYYMEAHKDYKNALHQLGQFLELCGLSFEEEK